MEKNEIKKALYKQKPVANFKMVRNSVAYYESVIQDEQAEPVPYTVNFAIPVSDMGDADLLPEMDGKLLIRYILAD